MLARPGPSVDADMKLIILDALQEAQDSNLSHFSQIEHAALALRDARPEITMVNALSLAHRYHFGQGR